MSKRDEGLTLLEVAIAGAILLGGLAFLAQLVRTTLSSTTHGYGQGAQVGPVVEQQLRLHAAHFKGLRRGGTNESQRVTIGTESIYTTAATRNYILPLAGGFGNQAIGLTEQEISARLTVNAQATASTDPVVGFTRFWKLDIYNGNERAGI